MAAPTEAELREAIGPRIREAIGNIWELVATNNALDPIVDSDQALSRRGWQDGFRPQDGHPGTFWADLTEDEAKDLMDTMDGVFDLDSLAATMTDAVVEAAVGFAERHPEMPRGRYQPARELVTA